MKNYFDSTWKYQKEYDVLYRIYVPATWPSLTLDWELLRAISRLTYEFYNNWNWNIDTKNPLDLYMYFVSLLAQYIDTNLVYRLSKLLRQPAVFNEQSNNIYNELMDAVIEKLLKINSNNK